MRITAAIKKNTLIKKQWLAGDISYPMTNEVGTCHKFPSLMDAFKWAGERYVPWLQGSSLVVKPNTVSYITAFGKGKYTISLNSVSFSGHRQSFHDGCPLIQLMVRERDGKLRLDGKIYAPSIEEQFIGSCLVAMFELYDVEVETSASDRLNELITA